MASNMTTKQLTEELDGFRAICREYFDGSEETQTAQSLHYAVDDWTEEISTLNEHIDDLTEENEKLKAEHNELYEFSNFKKWKDAEAENKKLKALIDDHFLRVVAVGQSSWEKLQTENDKLKAEIAELKKN